MIPAAGFGRKDGRDHLGHRLRPSGTTRESAFCLTAEEHCERLERVCAERHEDRYGFSRLVIRETSALSGLR